MCTTSARTAKEIPKIPFLTMELLEGETLAECLRSRGRFTKADALPLVTQMAGALSAAHRAGVIHRDFKTSNVILVGRGPERKAVVTDFGLARASFGLDDRSVTETGKLAGTLLYMAPEQLSQGKITPATDVYALGLVMYEMVTGHRPFGGDTPISAALKRLTEPPPSPAADAPGLDPRWEAAVLRCLERDPALRFQDPWEVVNALTAGQAEASTVTLPRARRPSPARRLPTRRLVTAGALLAVVLALAGFLFHINLGNNLASPPLKSVAVLPFDNVGGDPQAEYYCDGFTEDLINSLTRIPELRVIARESSLRLKRTGLTLQGMGKLLRVRLLVMGSIRRESGRLRVTARLVNAADGFQIWSQSYDQEDQDLQQIQDRLSTSVATAMGVKLAAAQIGGNRGPVPNLNAQDLYWMGRYHWRSRTEDGLRRAIEFFERAIEKDPGYAAAFAGLADVYSVLAEWNTMPPAEALSRARNAAAKAVSLNGNLAEAHVSFAHVTSLFDRDFEAAEWHFREALRLSPNLAAAHQWYSYMLLKQQRFAESMQHARQALDIDPVSIPANQNLAALFHFLRQQDDMIRQYRKVLELEPSHPFAHLMIAEALAERGLPSEAFREFDAIPAGTRDNPLGLRTLGEIGATLKNQAMAEDALRRLIAKKPSGGVSSCYIAGIYALLGRNDEAFQWLERAFGERDAFLSLLQVYPAFDSLRSDARYAPLLVRIGLKKRTAAG